MRLAIIGGGSWGTALATVLAPRFESLRLWVYETDLAERMAHQLSEIQLAMRRHARGARGSVRPVSHGDPVQG